MRHVSLLTFVFLCSWTLCTSFHVNRTIDDEFGDNITGRLPVYLPDGKWAEGSSCSSCHIHPALVDRTQAFDQTWHESTYTPDDTAITQIQLTFNGSAVYVYNLLADTIPGHDALTSLRFLLDGEPVGHFTHTPDESPVPILYHRLVYANESLANTEHQLIIEPHSTNISLILFDYVVYTTEAEPPTPQTSTIATFSQSMTSMPPSSEVSSSTHSNSPILVGVIVGTIVGVVVALLTLAISMLLLRKRRRWSYGSSFFRRESTKRISGRLAPDRTSALTDDTTSASSLLSRSPVPTLPPTSMPQPPPELVSRTASPLSHSVHTPRTCSPVLSTLDLNEEMGVPSGGHLVGFDTSSFPIRWSSGASTPLVRPPGHHVDVPAPAISAAGTEHSLRLAELTKEIRTLEGGLRELDGYEKGSIESPSRRNVTFHVLKYRVVHLRDQLEREKRLMAEALPRGKRVANV